MTKYNCRGIVGKTIKRLPTKSSEALIYLGGVYWFRTSDLLNVSVFYDNSSSCYQLVKP